jgi:hypothetical protein
LQQNGKKVTYSLLTDTTNAVSVLFQLLDCAVVSVVWKFMGHISENVLGVEGKQFFRGILDRHDSTLCVSL